MEAKDTVLNEKDIKTHARELSPEANEDLIRLGLTRLELFHICKDIGLLDIQAKIAFKAGQEDKLEALKKKGAFLTASQLQLISIHDAPKGGYLILIPEEEETAATTIINKAVEKRSSRRSHKPSSVGSTPTPATE